MIYKRNVNPLPFAASAHGHISLHSELRNESFLFFFLMYPLYYLKPILKMTPIVK